VITTDEETINDAFGAAKLQADLAYAAGREAEAARRRLAEMEMIEAAKAQEYGAPPAKIPAIVRERTQAARAEAEAAAIRSNDEAHKLRILHYELDRIRTIVDLRKMGD